MNPPMCSSFVDMMDKLEYGISTEVRAGYIKKNAKFTESNYLSYMNFIIQYRVPLSKPRRISYLAKVDAAVKAITIAFRGNCQDLTSSINRRMLAEYVDVARRQALAVRFNCKAADAIALLKASQREKYSATEHVDKLRLEGELVDKIRSYYSMLNRNQYHTRPSSEVEAHIIQFLNQFYDEDTLVGLMRSTSVHKVLES
jgi:hypothetical protein